jgi:hypothetical protein
VLGRTSASRFGPSFFETGIAAGSGAPGLGSAGGLEMQGAMDQWRATVSSSGFRPTEGVCLSVVAECISVADDGLLSAERRDRVRPLTAHFTPISAVEENAVAVAVPKDGSSEPATRRDVLGRRAPGQAMRGRREQLVTELRGVTEDKAVCSVSAAVGRVRGGGERAPLPTPQNPPPYSPPEGHRPRGGEGRGRPHRDLPGQRSTELLSRRATETSKPYSTNAKERVMHRPDLRQRSEMLQRELA